ncbi:MAG TPA: M15 family metallopeptidase [Rheinheimera sp.]|nr:M15 family metallopeptidase [Rheinheimera sp.]HJS16508.1 M15 family metallopeptidase [Rheinheimera sp.]
MTAQQKANRLLLKDLMQQQGFVPYELEWWHFTLQNETYPDTYFDFVVN